MPFVKMESSLLTSSPTDTTNSTVPTTNIENTETQTVTQQLAAVTVEIKDIVLHIKLKYDYSEIRAFYEELSEPNKDMVVGTKTLSVLQLYALYTLNNAVDMSNQTVRKVYRPTLCIHRNDEFSPFKYYFLLNLFDIEYTIEGEFPALWKTTFDTKVTVKLDESKSTEDSRATSTVNVSSNANPTTLLDVFKIICRERKYDESHATLWEDSFEAEQISTLDHLRSVTKSSWDKLPKIPEVVKQLIKDYIQMNADAVANSLDQQTSDPYKKSKATLIADIHRVRRYFYYVTQKIHLVSYLSREAVSLAIEEVKKTYDDDGNILINIQNYLNTFCLENRFEDQSSYEKKKSDWQLELDTLISEESINVEKINKLKIEVQQAEEKLKQSEERKQTVCHPTNEELMNKQVKSKLETTTLSETQKQRNMQAANNIRAEYQQKKDKAEEDVRTDLNECRKKKEEYRDLLAQAPSESAQIEHLKDLINMNFEESEKKLTVKYGRGLLLYGPPGTGKSELLKRIAIYAGITMITVPLSAGELNRPLVGETERLLVDIMYRAHTIPFLICAMTIDEIDGLVPKRDNNAQQSKVDGISVLLSHIEGVKNIPNLIVFGATNRRNMMDEAFLRRMQAKVFVGRPSPATRKNMLNPLICKSKDFTSKRIDALVKVTTNFSGAAVGALRSSIVVEMDRNPNIHDRRLLELADTVAREHNVWFGINTLPSICRLNPKIFDSKTEDEQFSLDFRDVPPSGRILIDLYDRKCLIELQEDEPTLERDLDAKETTIQSLLARLIQGCSTRNIDTIQIIDLNFLTKQNATDENQIFESLTTLFLECDEYNKSMLVFDIDSLIMLNKSDSEMTKSTSISNIRLYQFIREKCKETIVETKENEQNSNQNDAKPVEKWIVIIVKDEYLKSTLINDIEFKKTIVQIEEERREKAKSENDERSRKCPKCSRDYIPKDTKFGDCHYHDGFVIDCDKPTDTSTVTAKDAQLKMQQAELIKEEEETATVKTPLPKLVWGCCLHRYGSSHPGCRISKCGLPEELEGKVDMKSSDYMKTVEEYFMKNQVAIDNAKKFLEDYKKRPRSGIASAAKNK